MTRRMAKNIVDADAVGAEPAPAPVYCDAGLEQLGWAIMLQAREHATWQWLRDLREVNEARTRFVRQAIRWVEAADRAEWAPARMEWGHETRMEGIGWVESQLRGHEWVFNPVGELWRIFDGAERKEKARVVFGEVFHMLCEYDAERRCDHMKGWVP